MDGIPALDLRDLIVSVLGNTIQNHDRTEKPVVCRDKNHVQGQQSRGMFNVLNNVDFVSSNVQSSHQEALLYVSEDNEAVIKMILNGINLDPKIQIKYTDTKNQLPDMLTKGNFTRDEWNHLLCLFNISQFISTVCSEVMSKRTQEESGEERVTAKSRPMMSLIARAPSTLSPSASESPWKRSYESQSPLSMQAEKYDRTGQPVVGSDPRTAPGHHHKQFVESSYSARYSGWDDDKAWSSSQEWKSDELMDDRTRTPVVFSWARTNEFQSCFSREHTHVIFLRRRKSR